jgi:hypothetical protein
MVELFAAQPQKALLDKTYTDICKGCTADTKLKAYGETNSEAYFYTSGALGVVGDFLRSNGLFFQGKFAR